jgi:hypothetical protein
MLKYVVACVVAAGLCLAANQSRSSTETPRGAQPATRPAYTLDQLAWLAGRWEVSCRESVWRNIGPRPRAA